MILEKGERIIAEVRKHWFLYIAQVFPAVVLAFVPPVIVAGLAILDIQLPFLVDAADVALGLFVYCIFLLVLWVFAFVQWTDHYLDEWIITPERVIDIDQQGLFHREITSMRFDRVQDVTVEMPGMLATFLKYGEVRVQSAGDVREILMRHVRRPVEVKRLLVHQLKEVSDTPQEVTIAGDEGGTKEAPNEVDAQAR